MSKPRSVDLDAILGERSSIKVRLDGRDWMVPGELPPIIFELVQQGRLIDAAARLVGDEDAEDFAALLDKETFPILLEQVYGIGPEDAASSAGSSSTGKPPRPTSRRTTR